MARVYLETSYFSACATIRTGTIDLGRRATSLQWWNSEAKAFDLFRWLIPGEQKVFALAAVEDATAWVAAS